MAIRKTTREATREAEILMKNDDIKNQFRILDEDSDISTTLIELIVEPWYGVKYHYNTVKIQPETEDSELPLQFEYDIDYVPDGIVIEDGPPMIDFETFLGDVLVAIIVGKENEIRDNDTDESD
jgi:hypothetical protein